jgi:hypothetical protein
VSHHHQLLLATAFDIDVLTEAAARLQGLYSPDGRVHGTVTTTRPWDDDDGHVQVRLEAPTGGRLRDRRADFELTQLAGPCPHGDDPDRPSLQVWGDDAAALAVLTGIGELVGARLVVNDDWRPDERIELPVRRPQLDLAGRLERLEPLTGRAVADAARRIADLYGARPHPVSVPALARKGVPAFAAGS